MQRDNYVYTGPGGESQGKARQVCSSKRRSTMSHKHVPRSTRANERTKRPSDPEWSRAGPLDTRPINARFRRGRSRASAKREIAHQARRTLGMREWCEKKARTSTVWKARRPFLFWALVPRTRAETERADMAMAGAIAPTEATPLMAGTRAAILCSD